MKDKTKRIMNFRFDRYEDAENKLKNWQQRDYFLRSEDLSYGHFKRERLRN